MGGRFPTWLELLQYPDLNHDDDMDAPPPVQDEPAPAIEDEPGEWHGRQEEADQDAQDALKTTRELREEELAKGGE